MIKGSTHKRLQLFKLSVVFFSTVFNYHLLRKLLFYILVLENYQLKKWFTRIALMEVFYLNHTLIYLTFKLSTSVVKS